MSLFPPALEDAVAEPVAARARHRHAGVEVDDAALEAHGGGGQLERRRRRIPPVDGAVEQRTRRIGVEPPPVGRGDAADEQVGVVRGRGVEGANLPLRRHRDHGAQHARRPDAVDVALEVEVDGRDQRLAGHRCQRRRAHVLAHQAAPGVDLRIAQAGAPAQDAVVFPLEPRLPHDRSQGGVREPVVLQVGLGDLRDVADQVRHRLAARIDPLRLRLDDQAGQHRAVLLEPGHGLEGRVAEDDDGLVARRAPAPLDVRHRARVDRDDPGDALQHRTERVGRRRQQLDGEPGQVFGDDLALPVENRAARRFQRDGPQAVGLGAELVLVVLEDLRAEERADEDGEGEGQRPAGHRGALADLVGIEAVHVRRPAGWRATPARCRARSRRPRRCWPPAAGR